MIWYYCDTVKFTLENLLKEITQTNNQSRINQAKFTKFVFFYHYKKAFWLLEYICCLSTVNVY